MADFISTVPPFVLFSFLLILLSLLGAQVFSDTRRKEKRDDGQDLQIFEIKLLGIHHNGWPESVLLEGIKDAYERRSTADDESLLERVLKRGG